MGCAPNLLAPGFRCKLSSSMAAPKRSPSGRLKQCPLGYVARTTTQREGFRFMMPRSRFPSSEQSACARNAAANSSIESTTPTRTTLPGNSIALSQSGSPVTACPVGDGAVIPFAGNYSTTPITAAAVDNCSVLPLAPGSHCMFIPAAPNSNFGKPRTVFNPRQIQFGVKFSL